MTAGDTKTEEGVSVVIVHAGSLAAMGMGDNRAFWSRREIGKK